MPSSQEDRRNRNTDNLTAGVVRIWKFNDGGLAY